MVTQKYHSPDASRNSYSDIRTVSTSAEFVKLFSGSASFVYGTSSSARSPYSSSTIYKVGIAQARKNSHILITDKSVAEPHVSGHTIENNFFFIKMLCDWCLTVSIGIIHVLFHI